MSFLSAMFLPALIAAGAPVLIHLLNRRRFRTIEWAAMDFLREAVHRNRRLLVFRDVLLLALRTLAVVLFVLAMARPYRLATHQTGFAGQPVHAVMVVDNSLSMGYTQLDKSLLDVAKEKARKFIRELPDGSKVSLIPMCGSADWHGKEVYSTREDALEALERIEVSDRLARSTVAAETAARALRAATDVPTKRAVFLGDMQRESWSAQGLGDFFREIPDVQVVQVSPDRRSNTWVSGFRLRDGIADARGPAVFVGTIRHEGETARGRVRVTLKLDDAVIEERFVDLVPGQSMEVLFKHTFDVAGTPAEPLFVGAELSLSPDHLPGDDFRCLVVPVVANVPVVFIDQFGRDEDPRLNHYGETFPLRRLLAPRTSRQEDDKQLVEVRHRKPDEVTRDVLKDARLVAMAGVKSPPAELVQALREYVEQGGVLFLAAGDEFDPGAWQSAYAGGAGILPAPLKAVPIGRVPPPEALDAPVFHLAPGTMQDAVFHLDLPARDRQEIITAPFFYKAVAVDMEAGAKIEQSERVAIAARRQWLGDNDENEKRWAEMERKGALTALDKARREADRQHRRRMLPTWLVWTTPAEADLDSLPLDEAVQRALPRVMGRYDNGEVFAVRRDIGHGRVIMMTTGCFPRWNNLAAEHSVLLLDQALRNLLARSLPTRTFESVNEITIPVDSADQGAAFRARAPGAAEAERVGVEALGENAYGVILRAVDRRGLYRVERQPTRSGAQAQADGWTMLLAVNGPPEESELASLDEKALAEKLGEGRFRWVDADEDIRLEGMTLIGHNYWKYLMAMALVCLLVEMFFLAAPRLAGRSQS